MKFLARRGSATILLGAAALLAVSNAALAATATATFNVTANIVAACTTSAVDLGFGTYNPSSATALTGSTTINVSCTSGTPFTVALNAGTATGSAFTARHLANGASLLNYNLYTTAGATAVLGDATAGTSLLPGTGTGLLTPVVLTIYGIIPIHQDLPVGNYTSQITVTVNY